MGMSLEEAQKIERGDIISPDYDTFGLTGGNKYPVLDKKMTIHGLGFTVLGDDGQEKDIFYLWASAPKKVSCSVD